MPKETFRRIIYFISTVIAVTLCTQLYWNYKNYKDGRQQLTREVQSSVNNAIDSYFIDMAENYKIGISVTKEGRMIEDPKVDSLLHRMGKPDFEKGKDFLDRIDPKSIARIDVVSNNYLQKQDSLYENTVPSDAHTLESDLNLAKRIILSFKVDTLEIPVLNDYIDDQLRGSDIGIDYAYIFKGNTGIQQQHNEEILNEDRLHTTANSAYLPKNSTFDIYFTNIAFTVLKRNSLGIALSTILIATIVACLFFLLKIINRQKQLAELKNDLISNITHEFKTPISTAKVALEGIENFNKENDPAKTKKYLQVSNSQLDKLQLMVEKLLETATLDGNNLQMNMGEMPLLPLLSELTEKHRNLTKNKVLSFSASVDNISVFADPFHLENAFNNVFDNAVKYGGDKIDVVVSDEDKLVKITISDNGINLTKAQSEQVFEKFYRVPKGNTHDVKGFGIGLYYTKNIIEKHGGRILLQLNKQTNFIITLPRNG